MSVRLVGDPIGCFHRGDEIASAVGELSCVGDSTAALVGVPAPLHVGHLEGEELPGKAAIPAL